LFESQPLVVVAARDTAPNDVEILVKKVSELVKNKFGIDLEPEVRIIS
jgi:UDP-N-acetylenolpyruvoylglucosamine reductase